MALPTRADAIFTLEEGQHRLDSLLAQLSDEDFVRAGTIGGGDWSAKDLLAHVTTWEEAALEALGEWRSGRRPRIDVEVFEFGTEGVDRYNAERGAAKQGQTAEQTRRAAREVHAKLVDEIGGMDEEEWRSRSPVATDRRRHLAEMLGSILGAAKRPFGHVFAHLPDLEGFVHSLR